MSQNNTPKEDFINEHGEFVLNELDQIPVRNNHISRKPRYDGLGVISFIYLMMILISVFYWDDMLPSAWITSYAAVFERGNWPSLFGSLFVHADFGHLLSNAPMLFIFGYILHGYFGYLIFPFVCLVVGALTNLGSILCMPPHTQLIGASGMVYAMVAMWLVVYLNFETHYPFRTRLMRAIGFTLIVMIPTTYQKNVSYLAHGMGFGLGLLFGVMLIVFMTPQNHQSDQVESLVNS